MKLLKRICLFIIAVVIALFLVVINSNNVIIQAYTDPSPEDIRAIVEAKQATCAHDFAEFTLIEMPSIKTNGVEQRICNKCELAETREYVCQHDDVSVMSFSAATCSREGFERMACDLCGTITETIHYEQLPCTFGELERVKYATPFELGESNRKCSECGRIEVEYDSMEMAGEDSIYIPGTSINHQVYVGRFTQSDVDRHDIVYANDAWGHGPSNPFVLGHNTGTMKHIVNVEVGDYIYLSVDGQIEIYEVVISEFAMQTSSLTDIIGETTGASVWDSVGDKTLHMYTCYEGVKNGRWLILAKLIEQ